MRGIDSDIKSGQLKQIYFLYGQEAYLIKWYKNKLINAILGGMDDMNLSRFSGKGTDESSIAESAGELPFFADRRLVLVEDTGITDKKCPVLEDALDKLPDSTYMIFIEEKADKRKSFYKKLSKIGRAEEFKEATDKEIKNLVVGRLKRNGLEISQPVFNSFLLRTGSSLYNISNELDKLIDYCCGKSVVEPGDVDASCANYIEGKVFELIDAIAAKDIEKALLLYKDMLLMHEDPFRILPLMRTQFLRLLLLKDMDANGESDRDISSRTKIPSFYLGKNRRLVRNFSQKDLEAFIIEISKTEADMKTGRINKNIGIELLLHYCCE